MRKALRLGFIMLILMNVIGVKGQTYKDYHLMISQVEEQYFIQNHTDSALFYFEKCFKTFDFVFARDAINAVQIAYRENHSLDYFLKIAFEAGVTPSVLSSIPALYDFVMDSLPKLNAMQNYDRHREKYLKRINTTCLNNLYKLAIIDQITKGKVGVNQTSALFKMAAQHGLPGERNCGVEGYTITQELGGEVKDFIALRDSISEKHKKNIRYFRLDDNALIMHLPIVIMLHNYCTYKEYKDTLREAYLEGFIYSREIGCIYDNAYRDKNPNCLTAPHEGVFGLNAFLKTPHLDTVKANRLRKKWGICSVEADNKKREIEKLGYKFNWEYW